MQITPIGWLLIPLGMALAIFSPRRLLFLTVFFAPFSATAIANLGSDSNASGVQVYLYFSFLLIMQGSLHAIATLKFKIFRSLSRPLTYLFLFVLVCGFSILMPLWIDGRLQIVSPLLFDTTMTPLRFTTSNLTGVVYLFIGACSAAITAQHTLTPRDFRTIVRIYTLSGLFVSLWGLMQVGCYLTNIPYPSAIFNSSSTTSARGFDSVLIGSGLQRISSVAVEPSIFAAAMLTIVPFCLPVLFGKGHIVSRKLDKWIFGTMFVALLCSTSSTAYLGMAVFFALCLRYLAKYKGLRLIYVAMIFGVVAAVAASYVLIPTVRLLLDEALFSKAGGYSALERSRTVLYAYSYFLEYPLLGVGWSSVTSHDSIAKLLSNCGILGLLTFSSFVGSIFVALKRRLKLLSEAQVREAFDSPSLVMFVVISIAIIIAVIDGFPYVFGHFWVVLGLAMSAPALAPKDALLFQGITHE